MVERIGLLVAIAGSAALLALLARGRGRGVSAAPARSTAPQAGWAVPAQVDRGDFTRPDAPWLIAVFSSETCLGCKGTWEKARQLESDDVAVEELEATREKPLHQRYRIEAVPLVLVADQDGAVREWFVGEPSAADLWAAVAQLREPAAGE